MSFLIKLFLFYLLYKFFRFAIGAYQVYKLAQKNGGVFTQTYGTPNQKPPQNDSNTFEAEYKVVND